MFKMKKFLDVDSVGTPQLIMITLFSRLVNALDLLVIFISSVSEVG